MVIRSCKLHGNRQYNVKINNTQGQTMIYKTLHRKLNQATRTPQNTGCELMWSESISSSCFTYNTRRVTVKQHEHHMIWKSCCTSVCVNKYK